MTIYERMLMKEDPRAIGERNSMESDVIPDASLSVRDILTRFRRGTISQEELERKDCFNDFDDILATELDSCNDEIELLDLARKYKYQSDQIYEKIKNTAPTIGKGSSGSGSDGNGDSGEIPASTE